MNATKTMSAAELIAQTDLKPLRDWSPTALDCRGLGCDESNDGGAWLVVASHTPKTAGMRDTSNWETLQELLQEPDPDCNDHVILEFGHWATDVDVLIVRPGSEAHRAAELAVAALANYPVLDESDYSERQYQSQIDAIADALRQLTVEDDGADMTDWELFHEAVFEDLWESDQQALECSDEGCWIRPETINACLERMGYVYCEDDMIWLPESETEPVAA